MVIRNKLKVILAEKNMSQIELCEKININRSTLSNIISGKQGCTLENALDIAQALNVSVEDIFFKEIDDANALSDFEKMMEQLETIYQLYENNLFTRSDTVSIFKTLIANYTKKYDLMILDYSVDEYLGSDKPMNSIAKMILHGVE